MVARHALKVLQICRFDSSSLALADTDGQSTQPACSAMMPHACLEVCETAAAQNGLLPTTTPKAVLDHLKALELVSCLGDGSWALDHSCLQYGLRCEDPQLESHTRQRQSTLELQRALVQNGWTLVESARDASALARRALRNNVRAYYILLIHFGQNLADLEDQGFFSHKQSSHYYETIELAIVTAPDSPEFVPPGKKVQFYQSLCNFLRGPPATLNCPNM